MRMITVFNFGKESDLMIYKFEDLEMHRFKFLILNF
jgi:hypothetical protein